MSLDLGTYYGSELWLLGVNGPYFFLLSLILTEQNHSSLTEINKKELSLIQAFLQW